MDKKQRSKHKAPGRGGSIKRIGEKKYMIMWHQGRNKPNVRRVIRGTYETASRALQVVRERYYAGKFGLKVRQQTPITQLCQLVVDDYIANSYKDLKGANDLKRFWANFAGEISADDITTNQLKIWAKEWRANGLSAGRTNRRMAFLLRAYRIALEKGIIMDIPKWTALNEAPPRSGYLTWEEFVKVRAVMPMHSRVPVSIQYWIGTRAGETFSLEWRQIKFHHKEHMVEIRLDAADTKTSQERTAILGGDLYELLYEWFNVTKQSYPNCRHVCHFKGKRLTTIRTSWQTACVREGLGIWRNPGGRQVGNRRYKGALIHDFRRTAVSNMENAGIPRKTAMAISGHKTDSVYRRYHIVKKDSLIEAGRRLVKYHQQEHGQVSER